MNSGKRRHRSLKKPNKRTLNIVTSWKMNDKTNTPTLPSKIAEDEEEDEEILVYLEFASSNAADLLSPQLPEFKLIGATTDTPVVQLGNQVYNGKYEDVSGTYVMFSKSNENPLDFESIIDNPPDEMYQYECQTRKVMNLTRVFATKKTCIPDAIVNVDSSVEGVKGVTIVDDHVVEISIAEGQDSMDVTS